MVNAELTVAAIIERNGRFLMVEERVAGRTVLNQPAGHVEPGETLVEAVIRETQEETAWAFTPNACTGVYLWQGDKKNQGRPHILRSVFCGDCDQHDPEQDLDDGILATHWLSQEQLMQNPEKLRSPMVLKTIEDYLAGQRHALDLFHMLNANVNLKPQ